MTQYGQVRVDFITYTTGVAPNEANVTANVSGLFNSPTFSGNVLIKSDLNVDNKINTNTIDVTSNAVIGGDLTVSGNINGSGVNVSGFTGLFASGSETSPSISFIDDEDTGLYSFGPNHIGITTNGSGSVFIDSSGKVGIGVSNPSAYFQIQQAKFEITGLTAEREYIFPDETGTIALTSSNVASASQWQTARTITITGDASGNVSLDGSQNVNFNLDVARATNADNATTFSGLETSAFLRAGEDVITSGDMTANSFVGNGAGISNINAGAIAFGTISGERLPATITGDLVGNASSATNAASADFATNALNASGADTATIADNARNIEIFSGNDTDFENFIVFVSGNTGNQKASTDTDLYYNGQSNTLTAPNFDGNLQGNASTSDNWLNQMELTFQGDATGVVSFDGSTDPTCNLTVTNIAGNAGTSDKWRTARTFSIIGDGSGSVSLDGSQNVSLPLTVVNIAGNAATANQWTNSRTINVVGGASGNVQINGSEDVTLSLAVHNNQGASATADRWTTARNVNLEGDLNGSFTIDGSTDVTTNIQVVDNSHNHTIGNVTNLQTTLNNKLETTGNAASASKWNTARTITLGTDLTGNVSIDGSQDVTLNASVKNNSHNHTIANVTNLQDTLDGKLGVNDTAANASQWDNAITLTVIGGASGNVNIDGSQNVNLTLSDITADFATNADFATTAGTASDANVAFDSLKLSGNTLDKFVRTNTNVTITGSVTSTVGFAGNGGGITGINASNISLGTLNKNRLPSTIDSNTNGNAATATDAQNAANATTAETASTAQNAEKLGGIAAANYLRSDTAVTISGAVTATSFNGAGAGITGIDASNIASGTLDKNRLPITIDSNTNGVAANAINAVNALNASGANTANFATNASNASSADFATNSEQLAGQAASSYLRSDVPATFTGNLLTVNTSSENDGILIKAANNSANAGGLSIQSRRDNNSPLFNYSAYVRLAKFDGNGLIQNNDIIGGIVFGGNNTSPSLNNIAYSAAIAGIAESDFTNFDNTPTAIVIRTGNLAWSPGTTTSDPGNERMRVTSSGAVLVGTTTAPIESDSPGALTVQEKIIISNTNAGRNQIYVGDTGTVASSSGELQFNFQTLPTDSGVLVNSSAYVKIIINQRSNNDIATRSPTLEASFVIWRPSTNNTELVNLQLPFAWVYTSGDITGSILSSGAGYRVTVSNPVSRALTGSYKVEITTREGEWYLDSIDNF